MCQQACNTRLTAFPYVGAIRTNGHLNVTAADAAASGGDAAGWRRR